MARKTTGNMPLPEPAPAKPARAKPAPVPPAPIPAKGRVAKADALKTTPTKLAAKKTTANKTTTKTAATSSPSKASPSKAATPKTPARAKPRKAPAAQRSGILPPEGLAGDARPAPRRRAVANAAAAVHGRSVAPWSDAELTEAFRRFAALNPEPKGELDYTDAFTLLVAVVLSAQATDVGVNKATRGLFAAAATPRAMAALGEEGVAQHIRTLGLFRGKAKNVVELSRLLLERHGGEVPADRAALEALPGVGRKTANVVLNIAFGLPTIAVDTHLFRVANRTGMAPGATPLDVELALEARVPEAYKLHAHHWLILHGRYICKAQRPECPICPINDLCRWPDKPL